MSRFDWVAMNYTVYTMSCNSATHATHATCPLAFITYKHSELQVSFVTQKLNCKASYKTPFFS